MYVSDERGSPAAERFFALSVLIQPAAKQALEYRCIRHLVHADINHRCAGLHEVAGDHAGAADGGYENVGAAADCGQVGSLRMTDGDGGVCVEQQHGGGLADDVTTADDDGFLTGDGNVAAVQDLDDSGGRAPDQAGALRREKPDVDGMEAVDIFGGIDGHQDFFLVHLRGQRQLHQDAVNLVAAVQVFDQSEQFGGGRGFGWGVLLAVQANLFARFDFATDVNFRCRVVADEDDGEAGADSGGCHGLRFRSHFAADIVRDLRAVEDSGGHNLLP